jgi:GH24 family phage-related lysozyme (muramidase)
MSYAISPEGFALIQEHEGFRSRPEPLPSGDWVVGHGHVRPGAPGKRVTRNQAAVLLERDLAPVERLVNAKLKRRLTQSQYDALVSFAFSIGPDAFARSQVLKRVNAGEFVLAACAMEAWRKSDMSGEAQVAAALVLRRAAEKMLLLREVSEETAPSALLRATIDRTASVVPARASEMQHDPGRRITEVLMSEPATKAVLLAPPPQPQPSRDDEIATAHAKPVARRTDSSTRTCSRTNSRLHVFEPMENIGLVILLGLGLGLISLGASILFDGAGGLVEVVAAAALATPGVAIALTAAFAIRRSPPSEEPA